MQIIFMRMPLWLNLSSFSSGAKRRALVNHEVNAVPAHQSSVASIIMRAVMTFHRCINNGPSFAQETLRGGLATAQLATSQQGE